MNLAQKCSKANVLEKTIEYIRVLKKREQLNQLKAEHGDSINPCTLSRVKHKDFVTESLSILQREIGQCFELI